MFNILYNTKRGRNVDLGAMGRFSATRFETERVFVWPSANQKIQLSHTPHSSSDWLDCVRHLSLVPAAWLHSISTDGVSAVLPGLLCVSEGVHTQAHTCPLAGAAASSPSNRGLVCLRMDTVPSPAHCVPPPSDVRWEGYLSTVGALWTAERRE